MKWMTLAIALAASLHVATAEEEIEIYRGDEFTSPGAGHNEVLHYVRVITVSWRQWDKQPRAKPRAKPPLSVTKALELAEASLDPTEIAGSSNLHVTKLELRSLPGRDPDYPEVPVEFYVVSFRVHDNDLQRAVLMDGTVLKPQLTRLPKITKDKP